MRGHADPSVGGSGGRAESRSRWPTGTGRYGSMSVHEAMVTLQGGGQAVAEARSNTRGRDGAPMARPPGCSTWRFRPLALPGARIRLRAYGGGRRACRPRSCPRSCPRRPRSCPRSMPSVMPSPTVGAEPSSTLVLVSGGRSVLLAPAVSVPLISAVPRASSTGSPVACTSGMASAMGSSVTVSARLPDADEVGSVSVLGVGSGPPVKAGPSASRLSHCGDRWHGCAPRGHPGGRSGARTLNSRTRRPRRRGGRRGHHGGGGVLQGRTDLLGGGALGARARDGSRVDGVDEPGQQVLHDPVARGVDGRDDAVARRPRPSGAGREQPALDGRGLAQSTAAPTLGPLRQPASSRACPSSRQPPAAPAFSAAARASTAA